MTRLLFSPNLIGDDLEWSLDHSRRRYRVRRAHPGDLPDRSAAPPHFITIVRLSDGFRLPLLETCLGARMPFADTDIYAEHRLDIVNRQRRARGEAEI